MVKLMKMKEEKIPYEKIYIFLKKHEGNRFLPKQIMEATDISEGSFRNAIKQLMVRHMIIKKTEHININYYYYDKKHERAFDEG